MRNKKSDFLIKYTLIKLRYIYNKHKMSDNNESNDNNELDNDEPKDNDEPNDNNESNDNNEPNDNLSIFPIIQCDMSNAFANETHELKLIKFIIGPDMEKDEFDTYCKDIDKLIQSSYLSDDTDIEDIGDLIMLLNMIIDKMWIGEKQALEYYELLLLRKKAKKLAHKKFREGYDWIYRDEIKQKKVEPIIKYSDEKPRNYWNVHECVFQYNELVKYIWKPSTEKIFSNYINVYFPLNNQDNFNNKEED